MNGTQLGSQTDLQPEAGQCPNYVAVDETDTRQGRTANYTVRVDGRDFLFGHKRRFIPTISPTRGALSSANSY